MLSFVAFPSPTLRVGIVEDLGTYPAGRLPKTDLVVVSRRRQDDAHDDDDGRS